MVYRVPHRVSQKALIRGPGGMPLPLVTQRYLAGTRVSEDLGGIPAPVAAYTVENSCRFNAADSAKTTWTVGAAADSDKITTISVWVKKCNNGVTQTFFDAGSGNESFSFNADDLVILHGGTIRLQTNRKFRDPSAFYHIVVAYDTTASTGARVRLWVNGVEETSFSTDSDPTLNASHLGLLVNGQPQIIGDNSASAYFHGYLAEFVALDGIAATASSFGEFDSNGNWVPIDVSNLTFGTNGFYLDFAVAPGTGNGAGTDVSGETNHFTDSGLAANDQKTDSPTDDAENDVGNYCTWNPLLSEHWSRLNIPTSGSLAEGGLANGNLETVSGVGMMFGTMFPKTGKWYFELTMTFTAATSVGAGVAEMGYPGGTYGHSAATTYMRGCYLKDMHENKIDQDGTSSSFGSAIASTSVVGFALDCDNGAIYVRDDGAAWMDSGDPTSGATRTGAMFTWTAASKELGPAVCTADGTSEKFTLNTGQSAFADAAPTGYSALCTANLAAPAITDPSKYFQVDTFTGTGSELVRTLTDAAGVAVKPDLVWIKDRDSAVEHVFTDSVRGATKETNPNAVTAETTVAQGLKSFDTSGYTLGTDTNYNASSSANVAWCWNTQGGAGASNTDGSINTTSTSVGELQGMSFGVFDGTGSNATVGHGLSQAPELVIVHDMDNGNEAWTTQHVAFTGAQSIALNSTGGVGDDATAWQSTFPTSSVFSIGTNTNTNASGRTYIAWCMHGVEGYSKFGSYEGNASTDGTFVWLGFRPAFLLLKSIDSTSNWYIFDHKRNGFNAPSPHANPRLVANSDEIGDATEYIDILSNGFKSRITTDPNVAETWVFAAFAEFPFGGDGVSQARAR